MAINRFDQINDLWGFWSGAESAIVKNGNDVVSVAPVYGAVSHEFVQKDGTAFVTHDDTTMVGQVPCFIGNNGNSEMGLWINPVSPGIDLSSNGYTFIALAQWFSTTTSTSMPLHHAHTLSGAERTAITRRGNEGISGVVATERTVEGSTPTDAITFAIRHDVGANTGVLHVDGVETALTHAANTDLIERITVMNSVAGSSTFRGNLAMWAIYTRKLNDTEIADAITLMEYWRDNGEAPSLIEPSGTFGTVQTNNNAAIQQWQWEESSDGAVWDVVGTILTDTSGQGTQTLTVNSATSSMDQTQVRCRAYYVGGEIVSDTATLTVVTG